MIISNEVIEAQVGTPKVIDITSAELGIVAGGNLWSFNEGEEFLFEAKNYDEAVAYMKDNKRIVDIAKQKGGRAITYKFLKTELGKLLSLGTLCRRNREGKFHELSVGLPTGISIKDILDELDGKTIKIVKVDKFQTPSYDSAGVIKTDATGAPVMRDQKWYAFECK